MSVLGGISINGGVPSWQNDEEMTEILNDHFDHDYLSPEQAAYMLEHYNRPDLFHKHPVMSNMDEFWNTMWEQFIPVTSKKNCPTLVGLVQEMKEYIVQNNVQYLYTFSLNKTDFQILMVD